MVLILLIYIILIFHAFFKATSASITSTQNLLDRNRMIYFSAKALKNAI